MILNATVSAMYLASSALLLTFMALEAPAQRIRRAGFAAGIAGFAVHTAGMAVTVMSGEPLAGGLARSLFMFSWFTVAALLALGARTRGSSLWAFVFTLAFAATLTSALPAMGTAAPAAGPLIQTHIALVLGGQAFFFIAFVCAALYLVREKRIKSGTLAEDKGGSLLPITALDRVQHVSLLCGFPLATLGLALGFASANSATDWAWGGKETLSVATWLIYAVLINGRFAHGWKGRKSSLVAIAGFAAIAAVFFASGS